MNKFVVFLLVSLLPLFSSCTVNDETGEIEIAQTFWLVVLVIFSVFLLIFLVLLLFVDNKGKNEEKMNIERRGQELNKASEEFHVSAFVDGYMNSFKFIVDDVEKNIIFMETDSKKKIIPFQDIIDVEVIENNKTVSSKSMMRTVGGAVLGNFIAGGAGMIVGGLSGDTNTKKFVSKVQVKIKLRNLQEPSILIDCFDIYELSEKVKKEVKVTDFIYGPIYKECVEKAEKILELVGVIIDANEKGQSINSTKNEEEPEKNTVAELEKLVAMKEKGLLSDEEFALMKSSVIKKQNP